MKERHHKLANIRNREFDLVVIGGGINGAAAAELAAARGLTVLLLEKNDFASGASGHTNKLVHGHFPYLQQLQLNISKQEFAGRETLRRVAPHLVQEVSFVLPLIRNNVFFNMTAAVGNTLYETLRLSARKQAHAFLDKKKLANLVPALQMPNVLGGIQFTDITVDDARLVIAVLKSAEDNGAIGLNYVQVSGFSKENGRITGVQCRDRLAGKEFSVRCKACVNAAGTWAEEIISDSGSKFEESESIECLNLIVNSSAFETNAGLILPGDAGDFAFVFPWQHALLIGVGGIYSRAGGGKPAKGNEADQEEIENLLSRINRYLHSQKLNITDVKSYFRSKNPVIDASTGASTAPSAKVTELSPGFVGISGGLLSDYQTTAELVLKSLAACSPELKIASISAEKMLGGWSDKESYLAESSLIEIKAKRLGLDPSIIDHLVSTYGNESLHIVDLIEKQSSLGQRIISDFPVLEAEIYFSVISEMAVSVQDFMLRRTRLAVLNPEKSMEVAGKVAESMAKLLKWDKQRVQAELTALESEIIWMDQEANIASR